MMNTVSEWPYIAYLVFAAIAALRLCRRTESVFINSIVIFWLLAQPVLAAMFTIKIPGIPFDLSANRLLFMLLGTLLLLSVMNGKRVQVSGSSRQHHPPFQKYMIVFLIVIVIAVAVNHSYLPVKHLFSIPLEYMVFLIVYIYFSREATAAMLRAVIQAVILLAVINSVLSINQLMGNISFLATGEFQLAFGGIYRSMGIMPNENVMGSFQIIALFVCLAWYRGKKILWVLLPPIAFSVFLTFHRLDNLIMIFTILLYLRFYAARKASVITYVIIGLVFVATIPAYNVLKSISGASEAVESRLLADSLTGRFAQYGVIIRAMPRYPLGVASYDNRSYYELMARYGMTKSITLPDGTHEIKPVGVHNGFLAIAILYGISGLGIFSLMLYRMFQYFRLHVERNTPLTIVPLFTVIVWAMANISDPMVTFRSHNLMVIAVLVGLFVAAYRKGLLQPQNPNIPLTRLKS